METRFLREEERDERGWKKKEFGINIKSIHEFWSIIQFDTYNFDLVQLYEWNLNCDSDVYMKL